MQGLVLRKTITGNITRTVTISSPSTDMPNLSDHDFLVPNYLLSVSGYMYLEQMNDESHESDLPTYDLSQAIEVGSNEVIIELSDNLWDVLIKECKTQLNLTVTEAELRDIVVNTVSFDDANILFHGDDLKKVSECLSSFFHCEVIKVGPDDNLEVFNGQYDSIVNQSLIYYGFDDTNVMFYHVSFCKEIKERYKAIPGIDVKELKYDALGRLHLDSPYSGHCHLRIRLHKYISTTSATNITDLYDILAYHKQTKSVYMFLADGGFDFNPSHIAKDFYYRLFEKLDADILAVMTYAARYSAFSTIKHSWSPLSSKLSNVIFFIT